VPSRRNDPYFMCNLIESFGGLAHAHRGWGFALGRGFTIPPLKITVCYENIHQPLWLATDML